MTFQDYSGLYWQAHNELLRNGCTEEEIAAYLRSSANVQRWANDICRQAPVLQRAAAQTSIEGLGLNNLITSHLFRSRFQIRTLGDLERLSDAELLSIPGIAKKSLLNIRAIQLAGRNSAM
jgi:DNA-directed RNA polymerase alpha subunit